ncbi:MAG: NYN domain-containing protein [Mariniblastus sp.]|nr:NYN domain-containing protein [Mariniblastus sp.]
MTCATLIDGYNVIFGCGLYGKRATAASLAQARQRLLLEIGRHCGKRADTVSVVFDAQKVPSSAAVEQQNEFGIDVHYSVGYANADLLIDELIGAHTDPQRLTVVSSDHWVQNAARRRRAQFIDAEAWYYDQLRAAELPESSSGEEVKKRSTKPGNAVDAVDDLLNEDEINAWKRWANRREQLADDVPPEQDQDTEPGDPSPFPKEYLEELERQMRPPEDGS